MMIRIKQLHIHYPQVQKIAINVQMAPTMFLHKENVEFAAQKTKCLTSQQCNAKLVARINTLIRPMKLARNAQRIAPLANILRARTGPLAQLAALDSLSTLLKSSADQIVQTLLTISIGNITPANLAHLDQLSMKQLKLANLALMSALHALRIKRLAKFNATNVRAARFLTLKRSSVVSHAPHGKNITGRLKPAENALLINLTHMIQRIARIVHLDA